MTKTLASIAHINAARSEHSRGESILEIATAVEEAAKLGHQSFALVDVMNVSGMGDLYAACAKHKVRAIMGVTLLVYDDPKWRKPKKGEPGPTKNPMHSLKVYIRTAAGLKQVYKLLTLGSDAEHFYYNPRVGFEEVMDTLTPGDVSISTGDFNSVLAHVDWIDRCTRLHTLFGGDFWIEAPLVDTPLFDSVNMRAAEMQKTLGANCFATYPTLYPVGAADSMDVMRAIQSNNKMTDGWLPKPFVRDFSMSEPADTLARAKRIIDRGDVPRDFLVKAIESIPDFAGQEFFQFKKLEPSLPKMAPDEFHELVQQCIAGWRERFRRPVMGHQPTIAELEEAYKPRLKMELGVINKMGFSGYFLLVQEIVRWSKTNGIEVGPGRGSVGGSLIAYLMGITDVDPIRFDLLFERFINPGRQDLPDADLDFMSTRRHEIIEHIEAVYGKENVAGISNYSTLGPASAIRDCGRVHGLHEFDYACSKQTEKEHGTNVPLIESAENVPDIAKFASKFPAVWAHALTLEGRLRNLGTHAAGVVVAAEPIVNRAVVETRSGSQIVNWDKRTVEDHGLIKMDILGLSTLDTLSLARQYIKQRHFKNLDYLSLPLDDPKVLAAFGRGETVGVFQFESLGMRKLLTQLAEGADLTFDDLAAVTALFRPGPLDAGMCDQFVGIKQGKTPVYYEHALVERSLRSTYGVMVYQEQIMSMCRDLAGFTLPEADGIRKAIGKKDHKKMGEYEQQFVAGAMAGEVEVELEDGRVVKVHRHAKFRVQESADLFTVEEVLAKGLTLLDTLT